MNTHVDIGFVVAMKNEADILSSALGLSQIQHESGDFFVYSNSQESIVMLTPGQNIQFQCYGLPVSRVGKISSGVITTILIERFSPKCIINTGTAGGIASKDMQVGDIVIADFVTNHDIQIPLPGYMQYGSRAMPILHWKRIDGISASHKIGTVSSGESFITTADHWRAIRNSGAIAKEMEATGVVHAMEILNSTIPVYIIKSITDVNDENISHQQSSDEFIKNFETAMSTLSTCMKEIVEKKNELF